MGKIGSFRGSPGAVAGNVAVAVGAVDSTAGTVVVARNFVVVVGVGAGGKGAQEPRYMECPIYAISRGCFKHIGIVEVGAHKYWKTRSGVVEVGTGEKVARKQIYTKGDSSLGESIYKVCIY